MTPSISKRRRIVSDFNKKYGLYLTEDQMNSIVNSSYMSDVWKREIYAMKLKYDDVHQWLMGDMGWLRAYLLAFHVQDVTSDIMEQERIVTYTFEQVMNYMEFLGGVSQSKRISEINNKFFTDFDDVSFMIAYKFLESKGYHHELKREEILKNEDSVDDLLRKYEQEPTAESSAR